jgi:3-isopropylmalate/(R)-2-methylmalate dehydratase large subunit
MKTLFDKIWDNHAVTTVEDGPTQLYIDRHLCHEVTSPQAFSGMRNRGLKVFRPEQTILTADHNIPTMGQESPIKDAISRIQVETLARNAEEFGLTHYGLGHSKNGIVHVIGPENGYTQPGMTIVCGDSHTSTHGAFGTIAFGIGTSEVEMVLVSQCILQTRPKTMRVNFEGKLNPMVGAKDLALYMISQLSTSGATGYFVEYAGEAIRELSMEARMTMCNLSIEMGARGGEFAPKGDNWDKAMAYWETLKSDEGAKFDKEVTYDASTIKPMITYGTNPGMGMFIDGTIPELKDIDEAGKKSFQNSLNYMGFTEGEKLEGKPVDYVFLGSCTNGRIEDFRLFTEYVKGKKKADNITAWLVPGSWKVRKQIEAEGLDKILNESGFELRQPGCSACLAMNEDKIPAGKYAVSTSNRNFEGRQGPGSRTILAGPLVAAAVAVSGKITNPNSL